MVVLAVEGVGEKVFVPPIEEAFNNLKITVGIGRLGLNRLCRNFLPLNQL